MSDRQSDYANEYSEDRITFLTAEYERLSLFAEGML
jgi:hypothetical protein